MAFRFFIVFDAAAGQRTRSRFLADAQENYTGREGSKPFDRVEDFGIFQVRLRPIRLRERLSDLFGADVTLHHPFSRVLRDCEIRFFATVGSRD
jgi:hypothetical protein